MTRRWILFAVLSLGSACAEHAHDTGQPYDPEESAPNVVTQAVVPPPAPGTIVSCGTTSQCNNLAATLRPACSSLKWNVCKDAFCIWQVDSSLSQCKCIPGSMRRCTPTGISTCNAQGTGWGTCQ